MLEPVLKQVRACTYCAEHLPLGPRPVVRAKASARLMIIGQAPGTRVHETGIPWNDRSGERLRDWLDMDRDIFYDETKIAIMPMGFCYPGVDRRGGDNPPRPECAPLWHDRLLKELPAIALTLLIGQYAQKRYLGPSRGKSLTDTVQNFQTHLANNTLALPHPSWRTTGWQKKNPWFDTKLIPVLRKRVHDLLA